MEEKGTLDLYSGTTLRSDELAIIVESLKASSMITTTIAGINYEEEENWKKLKEKIPINLFRKLVSDEYLKLGGFDNEYSGKNFDAILDVFYQLVFKDVMKFVKENPSCQLTSDEMEGIASIIFHNILRHSVFLVEGSGNNNIGDSMIRISSENYVRDPDTVLETFTMFPNILSSMFIVQEYEPSTFLDDRSTGVSISRQKGTAPQSTLRHQFIHFEGWDRNIFNDSTSIYTKCMTVVYIVVDTIQRVIGRIPCLSDTVSVFHEFFKIDNRYGKRFMKYIDLFVPYVYLAIDVKKRKGSTGTEDLTVNLKKGLMLSYIDSDGDRYLEIYTHKFSWVEISNTGDAETVTSASDENGRSIMLIDYHMNGGLVFDIVSYIKMVNPTDKKNMFNRVDKKIHTMQTYGHVEQLDYYRAMTWTVTVKKLNGELKNEATRYVVSQLQNELAIDGSSNGSFDIERDSDMTPWIAKYINAWIDRTFTAKYPYTVYANIRSYTSKSIIDLLKRLSLIRILQKEQPPKPQPEVDKPKRQPLKKADVKEELPKVKREEVKTEPEDQPKAPKKKKVKKKPSYVETIWKTTKPVDEEKKRPSIIGSIPNRYPRGWYHNSHKWLTGSDVDLALHEGFLDDALYDVYPNRIDRHTAIREVLGPDQLSPDWEPYDRATAMDELSHIDKCMRSIDLERVQEGARNRR